MRQVGTQAPPVDILKRGRPRIYPDAAAKQREYRARKRRRLMQKIDLKELRERVRSAYADFDAKDNLALAFKRATPISWLTSPSP